MKISIKIGIVCGIGATLLGLAGCASKTAPDDASAASGASSNAVPPGQPARVAPNGPRGAAP